MAFATGEQVLLFHFGKLAERKDWSVKHDRLRRRAATNEDALEHVACAALSVYPHYQVWSASGGNCGAHSRGFLLADWCTAVATWPTIGRLHTKNSRGVHYPWDSLPQTRKNHTRPLSILHKWYSDEDTAYHTSMCVIYTRVCILATGKLLCTPTSTYILHVRVLEDSTRPRFATVVWRTNRNWPQPARKRATYAAGGKKTDESRQPLYPPPLDLDATGPKGHRGGVLECEHGGWRSANPSYCYAQNHDKYVTHIIRGCELYIYLSTNRYFHHSGKNNQATIRYFLLTFKAPPNRWPIFLSIIQLSQ